MQFAGSAASDEGAHRVDNDDAVFFGTSEGMALAVVADGTAGGWLSGAEAAKLAVGFAAANFARRLVLLAETWWKGEHGALLPAGERRATMAHIRFLLETRRAETPGDAAVLAHGLGDILRTVVREADEAMLRRVRENAGR